MATFTNLATNPSMVSTSGTVEVRRNLASDPRATVAASPTLGVAGWSSARWGGNGAPSVAYTVRTGQADGPVGISSYIRKTWGASPTSSTGSGISNTAGNPDNPSSTSGAGVPVTPGVTYTTSSFMRPSRQGLNLGIVVAFLDAAGAKIGSQVTGSPVAASAGAWTRISISTTAPAGAATMIITSEVLVNSSTWQASDTLDGTGLLIEASPVLGQYFDGSFSPDSDLSPSWTGAANASASILTGKKVVGITGGFQSTQWAADGTHSLRVDTGTATAVVTGPVTITARNPGQTATLGGVSVTSTTAGEALVLAGSGTLTLGVGWWDKLGDGIVQWFSGASGTDANWTHAWTGPANQSTSTRTPTPGLRIEGFTDAPVPRVGITLDGLDTTGPSRVTLWRSTAGGQRRKVRGWDRRQVYGSDYAIDYETPLGRPVRYDLVVDTGPTVPLRVSDTVTLDVADGFIQDPLQPLGAIAISDGLNVDRAPVLTNTAFRKLQYAVESSSAKILGGREPVAMTGQRMAVSGIDFSMLTEAAEQSTRLRTLLTEESLLLVRPLPDWGPLPDLVYTVPTVTEEPSYGEDGVVMTTWRLTGDSVRPPSINVLVALWTYDQVAALWTTYASAQAAATASAARYLDVQRDPTMGV